MKGEDLNLSDEERFEWEATEWIVKIDRGLSAEEQDSFFQWLGEDPRNGEAFAELRKSWKDFDSLAEWRPEHSEEPNPDLLGNLSATHSRQRRWKALLAVAAALALVLSTSLYWNFREELPSANQQLVSYETSNFGYQKLEDGSEVDLNENSRIELAYTDSTRLIRLLKGEAFFTVAKNQDRPFVVELPNGTRVKAIGTAFNVRLTPQRSVEVLVTEGRVRMEHDKQPIAARTATGSDAANTIDLTAGQQSVIVYQDEAPQADIRSVNTQEIEQALEWKPVVLDFAGTPLQEAIAAFNERNELQLQIGDEDLAELPIVASFRSNNVEGFAHLLELTMGLELQREDNSRIVLRSSK